MSPSPSTAPASTDLKPVPDEVRAYQRGWDEALDAAASRDYDTALAALQRAAAKVKEAELRNEAQADLEVLKLAASVLMTIPVAVLFFVFQRRIMNVSSGAVKE